ncbi:MAG: integrase catalytic domain-containing protein [Gammaproteobacteria bacterium]
MQEALRLAWLAANRVCAKRLVPFLPDLVASLERHGHLSLSDAVRAQVLSVSPATVDRLFRSLRQRDPSHGLSATKAGSLLKHQVPIRTFAEWDDVRPGFIEADLVAHCGGNASGSFLYTLVLTDVATGWTECVALLHRSQDAVTHGLDQVRRLLPMPLIGMDTDNGGEFINHQVIAYCEREKITFTRSRAYTKNDQCFVEQKNGSIVRQLVGYDRFEGERAYRQLAELYRAVRLYVNGFQPSMKLRTKHRTGTHVRRTYDLAQTPLQRLLASGVVPAAGADRLATIFAALDPVLLLRQMETLQDALWRHAVFPTAALAAPPGGPAAHFNPQTCGLGPAADAERTEGFAALTAAAGTKRAYRRSAKITGPRTYRTREDPFAAVWDEVCAWLTAAPERTARSVFDDLQQRYPDRYPDGQLRTLQRHVQLWRAQMILEFDDSWLDNDLLTGPRLVGALRARPAS